jgi:transposase
VVDGVTLLVPPDIDEAQLTRMIRAIRAASQ